MKHLQGKRALVTGAASGIGLAIVHELYDQGLHVVASDVSAGTAFRRSGPASRR